MAIQFVTIKCPECGADLKIEDGRDYAFCTYCGARAMMTNDNEHIYRTIDEARIKQAETDMMIRMRELDMEEKSTFSRRTIIIIWLSVSIILLLIGIIATGVENEKLGRLGLGLGVNVALWGGIALFGGKGKKQKKRILNESEVVITTAMTDCVDYHYNKADNLYRNAGFFNVNVIPLHDLNRFNMKKDGMVESITINGDENFEADDVYPKNANILITYHSK